MQSIDWTKLIVAILDRLVISQGELAGRCKVAQQTVSTWKKGKSPPGVSARRKLMQLANEAGLNLTYFTRTPSYMQTDKNNTYEHVSELSKDIMEFANLFQMLPAHIQEEIREFARFKLGIYKKSVGEPQVQGFSPNPYTARSVAFE